MLQMIEIARKNSRKSSHNICDEYKCSDELAFNHDVSKCSNFLVLRTLRSGRGGANVMNNYEAEEIAEITYKEVSFTSVAYTDRCFCYLLSFMSITKIFWHLYHKI